MLSYTKAAEDSSAVMDGTKEPAHGHLDGQKQSHRDRGVSEDTIKHPDPTQYEDQSICSADASMNYSVF